MVSLSSLTEDQTQKLTQYQAITQVEDVEEGISQLIEYNWNLERAIQHFYDNNTTEQEVARTIPSRATPTLPPRATPPTLPSRTRPSNRFSSLFSLLFWPFGFAWNITWSILSFFRFFTRQLEQQEKRKREPRALAAEFKTQFEARYGPDHIPFFEGGYSQALEKAKKELLFLLVLLHSEDHDSTDTFCQETLTDASLISFVQERRLLVWAGNVHASEAHKVSCTLQATTYPFMALIALQGAGTPKMTVIERIEGACHPEELKSQLEHAMERHGTVVARLQQEREQRERERQLRVDQDAAYHQSLKADQEKVRRQQEEEETRAQEEKERQLVLEQRALLRQKREQYIQYLYAQLPTEASTAGQTAKINFRLPDGDRVVRQFQPEATVDTLYQFVQVYPLLKENKPKQQVEAPLDYQHQYRFTLHSTFPRMEFSPDNSTPLMEIKSLWPSATLVVDHNDDDDNEE